MICIYNHGFTLISLRRIRFTDTISCENDTNDFRRNSSVSGLTNEGHSTTKKQKTQRRHRLFDSKYDASKFTQQLPQDTKFVRENAPADHLRMRILRTHYIDKSWRRKRREGEGREKKERKKQGREKVKEKKEPLEVTHIMYGLSSTSSRKRNMSYGVRIYVNSLRVCVNEFRSRVVARVTQPDENNWVAAGLRLHD